MADKIYCPSCGKENRPEDYNCRFCATDLNRFLEDDFSELDYRPKRKTALIIPGLVILLVLGMIAVGIFYMNDWFGLLAEEEEVETPELEIPEDEPVQVEEEPEESEPEPEAEEEPEVEQEPEEPDPVETVQPDYDQLESAIHEWLMERVDDPDVILLHVDDADDPVEFYDQYDPVEENIIVYKEESRDDEFVTVIFGPPFSEWSIRAVFIWDQAEWRFLREEDFH